MPVDKCYTKKTKNGGNYTTCVDKKGDQLREKDVKPKKKKRLYIKKPAVKTRPKPPPPPGMSQADADVMVKDVLNYNKISSATQDYEADVSEYDRILSATTSYNTNNVSDYNKILTATTAYEARQNTTTAAPLQNVSAHMSALSASAPTAPPANYNMLRPEIRRNILEFAGAKSPIDVARDELIELATGRQHPQGLERKGRLRLEQSWVFFVINNTLDKIGSRNLRELDIATTYKTSPRARKIFLRDPIEVLKEYRKRTGEVKYKKVIEMTLNRMKVYYKLMNTANDATPGITPYIGQYEAEIAAIVKKNKNLFKNNFFPNAVRQKIKGQNIATFRTDGIKDTVDGGLNFDYSDPMNVVVSFDRMYINIKSNSDFTKLIKEIHTGIKNVQERVLMDYNERDMKNLLAQESEIELKKLQEEAETAKAKYKSQMEALAKSQNKILSNDGKGGYYMV